MGVPKFFGTWLLRQRHFRSINGQTPPQVDGLLIDLNSLIHQAAQFVYGYGGSKPLPREMLEKKSKETLFTETAQVLESLIMDLVSAINPSSILYLAVDGVAPMAKINQQRSRRFGRFSGVEGIFDANSISPGTEFMIAIDQHLSHWIKSNDYLPTEVIYSSHLLPGEGEHKLMSFLRSYRDPVATFVVHGLDTDLVFLCLLAPIERLFLWRVFADGSRIVVDIASLRVEISQYTKNVVNFVTLMMFIGNDFIPVQPSMKDFSRSINAIIEAFRESGVDTLVHEDMSLHIENMCAVLEKMLPFEKTLLEMFAASTFKYPSPAVTYAVKESRGTSFDLSRYRDYWYSRALFPPEVLPKNARKSTPRIRSEKGKVSRNSSQSWGTAQTEFGEIDDAGVPIMETTLPSKVITSSQDPVFLKEKVKSLCISYLQAIQWVMLYYTQDELDLTFVFPFYYPPLFSDFHDFLSLIRDSLGEETHLQELRVLSEDKPSIDPYAALLCILPPRSKEIAPEEIRPLLSYRGPLGWSYPRVYQIAYDGVDEEWRFVAMLPWILHEDLLKIEGEIPLSPEGVLLVEEKTPPCALRVRVRQEIRPVEGPPRIKTPSHGQLPLRSKADPTRRVMRKSNDLHKSRRGGISLLRH